MHFIEKKRVSTKMILHGVANENLKTNSKKQGHNKRTRKAKMNQQANGVMDKLNTWAGDDS